MKIIIQLLEYYFTYQGIFQFLQFLTVDIKRGLCSNGVCPAGGSILYLLHFAWGVHGDDIDLYVKAEMLTVEFEYIQTTWKRSNTSIHFSHYICDEPTQSLSVQNNS